MRINIKWLILSATTFFVTANAQNPTPWQIDNISGQDSLDTKGIFHTYAIPADYPYSEGLSQFNVSVNDSYCGIYNDRNFWDGNVGFTSFDFEDGKYVEIEVASRKDINSYEILPKSASFTAEQTSPRNIKIRTNKANQKLTVVFNDDYKGDVLHIFANSFDTKAPAVKLQPGENYKYIKEANLHYFGAGYHKLSDRFPNGDLNLNTGGNIYVAGGAVIDGHIGVTNSHNNTKIQGRGLIMNAEPKIVLSIHWSDGCDVDGVMIHGHRAQTWCTMIGTSRNVNFSNVKIITTRYASTDGIDISHCQNLAFDNVFVRSCDDAIAIKGLAGNNKAPADMPANKNITFRRMQLWNDCNCAFGMGAETRAAEYENIRFSDSDILFSYDDPNYHAQLDERAAMNICSLQGTYFRNIIFEDIRVNRCERLISLGFKPSFWFGTIPGDQQYPGGINGITFRNIHCESQSRSSIANEINLYGWHSEGTPDKFIENITFDNVVINNELLQNGSNLIKTNNTDSLKLVKNLIFTDSNKHDLKTKIQ